MKSHLEHLAVILAAIVILGVTFDVSAVVIVFLWLLFHAKTTIAVTFMVTSLIAVVAVLIYRYYK